MQVVGDYNRDGYAYLRELIPTEIGQAFLQHISGAIGERPIPLSGVDQHANLLRRAAFEIYGHHFAPMLFFLWGLTPTVSQIVGRELLPTYDYFRLYREGDVCRVHSDRHSCEHSLSLTLDYSDGAIWPLEIGTEQRQPSAQVDEDWGNEPYVPLAMEVGDAVLYQGFHHRHARTKPNPNEWSAHLFLHWVERDGPHADHAFDGQIKPAPVNFRFC
ncbi:MAG: hypothetical protein ACJ8FC_02165 [Sphingomicrobium sp.]